MSKKLAISFITYNRAKHINEDLSRIAQQTKKKGIDIYIFDGSTNTDTEKVVSRFKNQGYEHIRYYHYGDDFESNLLRARDSFFLPEADYVWRTGDKFVISPNHYDSVLKYIDRSYDIITIYDTLSKGARIFSDPVSYAKCCIVPFTHIGTVIVKKDLFTDKDFSVTAKQSLGFAHVLMYCRMMDKPSFKGVAIQAYGSNLYLSSKYGTKSVSMARMWDIWVTDWHHAIMCMPKRYDGIKDSILSKPDEVMNFFDLKSLLRQRGEGQFDFKKCWRDRKFFSKVICMPKPIVYLISLLPKKVAKTLSLLAG